MITPPVTVVVEGRIVFSSEPAVVVRGAVMAPLDPYGPSVATTISVDPRQGTIALTRRGTTVTVTVGRRAAVAGAATVALPIAPFLRDGVPFIPLAIIARRLGGTALYDPRSRTLALTFEQRVPMATPSPYRPTPGLRYVPPPAPEPTLRTPGPVGTWTPEPRRTPIEPNRR